MRNHIVIDLQSKEQSLLFFLTDQKKKKEISLSRMCLIITYLFETSLHKTKNEYFPSIKIVTILGVTIKKKKSTGTIHGYILHTFFLFLPIFFLFILVRGFSIFLYPFPYLCLYPYLFLFQIHIHHQIVL